MHDVQTWSRLGDPFTMARTRWMLGFQRRLVRRCEWLMLMPNEGCLPHTSQTAAMTRLPPTSFRGPGKVSIAQHDCAGRYRRLPPEAPGGLDAGEEAGLGPRRGDDMTTLLRLAAGDLRQAVIGYRDLLRVHQEAINRLNVYPVPDGDTGTNMALTLESVVAEMGDADDMTSVTKAISHGSLMGARGNSGVILSQILRGIAKTCDGSDAVDGPLFAEALAAASEAAYGAVMRPVEGTILSVCKAAAEGAGQAGRDMVDV